jgi:hypothetical protein
MNIFKTPGVGRSRLACRLAAVLGAALAAGSGSLARGSIINYSESITTNGQLGSTPFTNALVTLTFSADPSKVTFFQGSDFTQYTNIPTVSTVTVAGVGTATFSDPISVSVSAYPTFSEFGSTDISASNDILDDYAVTAGFAGYKMSSSFGPVAGGAAYPVGAPFPTSLGGFEFTQTGGGVTTFSATAVPEPSGAAAIAVGLCVIACRRRAAMRVG